MRLSAVAAEVLEARQVMTVTSPISLSTATANALASQTALNTARNNFATTMTGLENTLSGDFTAHANTANGLVTSAEGTFNGNVTFINNALNLSLNGLSNTFNGQVDGHETTLDGAIVAAQGTFQSSMIGPRTTYDGAVLGAQTFFDGQLTTANGVLNGVVSGLRTSLDGTVTTQQGISQGNIGGFNTTFYNFANGQQTTYDGQELGFWNNYLTTMDSSPTGLQGIYNASITSAAAIRDPILTANPNVFYNPEILVGTSAYDALITGANNTLYTTLTPTRNTFNTDVANHEGTFQTAIYGPGGAMSVFGTAITAADVEMEGKLVTARTTYDTVVNPALAIYQNTVNGPTGLQHTFETNVAGVQAIYNGAVQTAQNIRNGAMVTAQGIHDTAVATAEGDYAIWTTGKNPAGGTQTKTTIVAHYTPLILGLKEFWKTNATVTDSNGVSVNTLSQWTKPAVPKGTLVPGSTTSAMVTIGGNTWICTTQTIQESLPANNSTTGNAFAEAMDDLTDVTQQVIAGLAIDLNTTITGLQTTLQGQITAANSVYDTAMTNATTGITTNFVNATNIASMGAMTATNLNFTNYQTAIMPLMMFMPGIFMPGMPPPPPPNMTPIYQATQDYALNVIAQEVTYTNTVGGAYVGYVTQERAADTARDITIVNHINSYMQQAINAVNQFQTDAMSTFKGWLDGMTDLDAGYATHDASELGDLQGDINDAAQTQGLAGNTADEQFAIAESNAALTRNQGVATEVESFRNGEMGARVTFLQVEAPAAKDFDTDVVEAIGDASGRMVDGANAQNAYAITATNAGETLQNNLLGDQTTYTTAMTPAVVAWVTTVSNGVASQWAAYMGGGADVTAVANAWAAFEQAAAGAWVSLTNGEATAFQSYGTSEAGAGKTAQQNVSAQNIPRITSIGGELLAYDGVVGGGLLSARQGSNAALTPWMTNVAAGERSADNQISTAGNTFELAADSLAHTAQDSGVNALHAFVSNVLGSWSPYVQNAIAQDQSSQHLRIGQFNTLMTSTRTARTAQSQSDRGSWQTFASTAAGAEDALVVAAAKNQKDQGVLSAVNRFNTTAAMAPSTFAGSVNQRRNFMPMEGMMMTSSRMNDTTAKMIAGIPDMKIDLAIKPSSSLQRIPFGTQITTPSQQFLEQLWGQGHPMVAASMAATANRIYQDPHGMLSLPATPLSPPTVPAWMPFVGSMHHAMYNFEVGNNGWGTFYLASYMGDIFVVRSVVCGGAKLVMRDGARLLAEEATAGGIMTFPQLTGRLVPTGASVVSRIDYLSYGGEFLDDAIRIPEAATPFRSNSLTHIFVEHHNLLDSPANRRLIQSVADDLGSYLGRDRFGTEWYSRILPDGRQIWVQARNGAIFDAGANPPGFYRIFNFL